MNPLDAIVAAAGPNRPGEERARLREAAEAFEALLIQQMFKGMREAQLDEGFFGETTGSFVYEAMFEEGLAGSLSRSSPLGVADQLETLWLEREGGMQEAERALNRVEALQAEGRSAGVALDSQGPEMFKSPGPKPISSDVRRLSLGPAKDGNHEDP